MTQVPAQEVELTYGLYTIEDLAPVEIKENDLLVINSLREPDSNYLTGRATMKDLVDFLGTQGIAGSGSEGATGIQGPPGPAGTVIISDTPPPEPDDGQLWYDTLDGNLYIWYAEQDGDTKQWVDATPGVGATGPQGASGATGPKGDKGDASSILNYLGDGPSGQYPDALIFNIANGTIPQPEIGDSYRNPDTLDFWAWDGDEWIELGPIVQGPEGSTGATGPTGSPGGATGATGIQGIPGSPGGATGGLGATGEQGSTGPTGPIGATGPVGATGPKGADSFIPGPIGVPGSTGPTGALGPTGATGQWGATGATGLTGNPGTNGTNGARGPQGATGITGPPGSNGSNGGPGPTGARGPQGVVGPTGATGAKGNTGAPGSNGSNGGPGPTGPRGATGLTGPAGSNGSNGGPGPTGPAGPTVPYNVTRSSTNWIVNPAWAYTYSVPGDSRIQSNNTLYNEGGGRARFGRSFYADDTVWGAGWSSVNRGGSYMSADSHGCGIRSSSLSTKTDVTPIDSDQSGFAIGDTAVDEFDQIEFVRYKYDLTHPLNEHYGEHPYQLGVISEQLKDINEDWVTEVPNTYYNPETLEYEPRWPEITDPIYALNNHNLAMLTMHVLKKTREQLQAAEARIAQLESQ